MEVTEPLGGQSLLEEYLCRVFTERWKGLPVAPFMVMRQSDQGQPDKIWVYQVVLIPMFETVVASLWLRRFRRSRSGNPEIAMRN